MKESHIKTLLNFFPKKKSYKTLIKYLSTTIISLIKKFKKKYKPSSPSIMAKIPTKIITLSLKNLFKATSLEAQTIKIPKMKTITHLKSQKFCKKTKKSIVRYKKI